MMFGGDAFVETAVFASREADDRAVGAPGFRNAADTDPSLPGEPRRGAATSWPASTGRPPATRRSPPRWSPTPTTLEATVARVRDAAAAWGAQPASERAAVLRGRRARARGPPRRADRGRGIRDRQGVRRGRRRGQRGRRLRELLRRDGPRARPGERCRVRPLAAHGRHPAVELPGRDPGRRRARRARGRIGRRLQARPAGPPVRGRARRGAVGGRRARAMCWPSSTSTRARSGSGSSRTPTSTG